MKNTKRRARKTVKIIAPAKQRAVPLRSARVEPAVALMRLGSDRQTVVFTSGDAGHAWMATALFAMLADSERARPVLAASMPSARILYEALAAVREAGCDASDVIVREPSASLFASADLVVTMGSTYRRELLVDTPHHRREHWLVPEVLGADTFERARLARDLIRSRVAMLVFMEGWGRLDLSREAARATRPRRTAEMQAAL